MQLIIKKLLQLELLPIYKKKLHDFCNTFKLQIHQYERTIASRESYYVWCLDIGYICAYSQGDAAIHQKAIAPRTLDIFKQCTWFFHTFKLKGINNDGQ